MTSVAGAAAASAWDRVRGRDPRPPADANRVNVGRAERLASGVVGGLLIGFSLRRKRLRGLLVPVGIGLMRRAVTGHCEVNAALGRNSARRRGSAILDRLKQGEGTRIEQAVVISRPRDELFQF